MKRIVPDSLGGWLFTVVVAAVLLIYGSTLVTYFIYRDQSAEVAAASQVADQLIVFKRLIERAPLRERNSLIQALNSPGLRMVITTRPLVAGSDEVFTSRIIYRRLMAEFPEGTEIHTDSRIAESLGEERFPTQEEVRRELRRQRLEMQHPLRSLGAVLPQPPPPVALGFQPFVRASIRFGERTWLNARVDLDLTEAGERTRPFLQTAFLWTTLITFLIAILAILAVRRATMPVSLFAKAAERLGLGLNAEPLSESGTGEVRRAARAFNTMQSRLQRFVKDRTQMLAAISHDLRTPITRMRLRAEFVDDSEQREKMLSDLDDMEAMISVTLAFAREDAANEPAAPTDVAALVARIVSDEEEGGHAVSYTGPESLERIIRPLGLKRSLANIVGNAIKYGGCADVLLTKTEDGIEIFIDDKGPGILEAEKEQVFTPFFRLEGSRSRDTGGTGLGMTIARNAIRSMGGDIELLDRADGGLRVRVMLPVKS